MKPTQIPDIPREIPHETERGGDRAAMIDGIIEISPDAWDVPSGGRGGWRYRVTRCARGTLSCPCPRFQYEFDCPHTEVVWRLIGAARGCPSKLHEMFWSGTEVQRRLAVAALHRRATVKREFLRWALEGRG